MGGLVVLLVAGVAGVALAYPSVAATTCPGCYGLERVRPGLYLEPGMAPERRAQAIRSVGVAGERVRAFYKGRRSDPNILICATAACYRRIGGGGERGVAVLNRALMLSPRGIDPVIASHELSHVELHARLAGADVPQWFDEGLAVLVSDDPRYLTRSGDRCRVATDEPLPATLSAWLSAAKADPRVYAKAACRTSRRLIAEGGEAAVPALVERLAAGKLTLR